MNKVNRLDSDLLSSFNDFGLVVIPNFYDAKTEIEPIQHDIYELIGLVAEKYGIKISRPKFCPETFDAGYLDLISVNRAYGGEVYDAVKQIPSFVRLVSSLKNEKLYSFLRRNSLPGIAAGGYGIRINNPFEEMYRASWHQEYPAQLRSIDGIVFWSPLVQVLKEMGPVSILPKSHKEGPLAVFTSDPKNEGKAGAYALILEKEGEILEKYEEVAPLTKPTDLVLMDFLAVHASGFNSSNRALWSMQFRYFNYLDATGRSHGWKGSFASGVDFKEVHPNLCAN
jgi:hypothetical protein